MSLVRFENVSKSFAGEPVLAGVSLRVEEGERVGLIGRNGTGKSTIFRIITGEVEPESGLVERMRRARVACLAQLPKVPGHTTIFETVLHSFQDLLDLEKELGRLEARMSEGDEAALEPYGHLQEEFTARGGYEFRANVKRVLHGLGFTVEDFELPYSALSGGQRTRLMLALVLLQNADLLLLDEPENHLDLEAREWLETYLKECRGGVVIISHDRQMLNHVVDRIIEVERGEARVYVGNYDQYLKEKALIREQQQKEYERQQEFLRKEQVFINRFRYKATKARQVQSRLKRLEKIELVEAPPQEMDAASFRLGEVVRSGQVMLSAKGLSMGYGALTLYRGVGFEVHRGERVGIIGPNGAGKTTLLRQLAGRLKGLSGEVTLGNKVSLGYYDQHHEGLNPDGDILTEVLAADPKLTPEKVRTFMGRFLFTGDDVFKTIKTLSGGELSRVAMARLILGGHNLIFLDEPTNHLDIVSREALEGALAEFPGALVMVSHDRALIDRLVDKLIILEHGRAEVHLGNYTHYRWKLVETAAAQAAAAAPKATDEVLKIRRQAAARPKSKEEERDARRKRRQLEQLERDIEGMEALLGGYDERFAALDPTDYAQAQALKTEYDGLKADLQGLYAEWERLAEAAAED